ncbi:helix-turn-helix domain-containing protein [Rhizobium sp. L1K21]|uniref:helix-turn-helix domain-containing protein n=1 Tax=Rhizobium sp. L1K21 TaxID=2954933 RepID=UPI002092704C|nr:helix-turn-helix transcriptional regulator [Rhizobium sp. L1K21]MCO6186714.1 helix-turn-helix domain-containing protein [Rhizobium sp. L1K21]
MSKIEVKIGSRNVFADTGYPDADTHQLKARIVSAIEDIIDDQKLTQTAAGKIMGISQPEVSRMLKGQFRDFSVERLMAFLTCFSRDVEIVVRRHPKAGEQGQITLKAEMA